MSVKEFWKSVKKWQSYGHEFGVSLFFGTRCIWLNTSSSSDVFFAGWRYFRPTWRRHQQSPML